MSNTVPTITPYEWTNGGEEVLILRFSDKDGTAWGGFQHPMNIGDTVTAPDWNETAECGGGIHGWAWGHSLGDGKEPDYSNNVIWQVYGAQPEDIRQISGKCKFRHGTLRFVGTWNKAMEFINPGRIALIEYASRGAASATGDNSIAMAGDYGCIALAWWNQAEHRSEMRCATTGPGMQLKSHTWYSIDENGMFVEKPGE